MNTTGDISAQAAIVHRLMGGNASPDLADLTLSAMEIKFCLKAVNHVKKQLSKAVVSRYIYDHYIAQCPAFIDALKLIYPHELVLEKGTTNWPFWIKPFPLDHGRIAYGSMTKR